MEIETKNATLATMSVTINALHVNGKQMTLAVFRQLPIGVEKSEGDIWGIVRYSIKDEGDLWVVFSKDGRLYRRWLNIGSVVNFDSRLSYLDKRIKELKGHMSWHYFHKHKRDGEVTPEETIQRLQMEYELESVECAGLVIRETDRLKYEERLLQMPQLFIAV